MPSFRLPTLLLSGPTGVGKSVAVIKATNPESTYWICAERGALLPAVDPNINPSGKIPQHDTATDLARPWEETIAYIRKGMEGHKKGIFRTIVLDTISSLADREYLRIRNADHVTDKYGAANRMLRTRVLPVVWELLNCGAMIIVLSHDKEPTQIDGILTKGGPRLPGDLLQTVPSLFDIVLRARRGAGPDGSTMRLIRFDAMDERYTDKDRFGIVKDGDPLDLKRILVEAVSRMEKLG